jgi:hypothetical protein
MENRFIHFPAHYHHFSVNFTKMYRDMRVRAALDDAHKMIQSFFMAIKSRKTFDEEKLVNKTMNNMYIILWAYVGAPFLLK